MMFIKPDYLKPPLIEKCNNCSLYYFPPYYLCPKGHKLCNYCTQETPYMQSKVLYTLRHQNDLQLECITKLELFCGECSNYYWRVEERRDSKLELKNKSKIYSCLYEDHGCKFLSPYPGIENHIFACDFCMKRCYWQNCIWRGTVLDLKKHLLLHPLLCMNKVEALKHHSTYTLFRENDLFMIKTYVSRRDVKFSVKYCGVPNKYIFEIHLGTKEQCYVEMKHVIPNMKYSKHSEISFVNESKIFIANFQCLRQF
ncbi:hypothetical protein HHI36_023184 [Cryptolaemus montrouzieri]|uniref:Uncharacterized protein n=1 Tax=Cryptolaemus montrouzieri TaxID=559131 RepID=A0ABD2PFQ5_9CUCU